jgi:hypothetical protein
LAAETRAAPLSLLDMTLTSVLSAPGVCFWANALMSLVDLLSAPFGLPRGTIKSEYFSRHWLMLGCGAVSLYCYGL